MTDLSTLHDIFATSPLKATPVCGQHLPASLNVVVKANSILMIGVRGLPAEYSIF